MNKAQISKYFEVVRSSYWFVPTLMVIGAIVLSIVTIWIDGKISFDWPEKVPFLFSNKPDGARAVLATVAGSMINVAGVTFSLTLLAVSHATGQFGPRLLNNFMRDRGNQITLGTFIATFLYCLLVLRTVRAADEPPHNKEVVENLVTEFVPHLSITVALGLTLCSVGVLIYFIHHIPESIRLSNVVSGIGRQLSSSIDQVFPESVAKPQPGDKKQDPFEGLPDDFFESAKTIKSNHAGYLQSVDEQGVFDVAQKNDLIVYMVRRPGDFCCEEDELVLAWPGQRVSEEVERQISDKFAFGVHRTMNQNVMFGIDQLVEVAQRALSPGINDPMTAIYCMDWIQTTLIKLTKRESPEVFRYDEKGEMRVFTRPIEFGDFCSRVFDQLRQCVATNRNATMHMMGTINDIRNAASNDKQLAILNDQADRLIEAFQNNHPPEFDLSELKALNKTGLKQLENGFVRYKRLFDGSEDRSSG